MYFDVVSQDLNIQKKIVRFFKNSKLWRATKFTKNIKLTKVSGFLKTSFQWLLNCIKQQIPRVIFDCVFTAYR